MEHLEAYNRKLLANILPVHVAEHFLSSDKNNDVYNFRLLNSIFLHLHFFCRNSIMNSAILSASCLHQFQTFRNSM